MPGIARAYCFRGKNAHANRPHHCPSGPGGHDGCEDVLAAHKNQNNTEDLEFTMSKLVADQIVETLKAAGVKRIYGIVGDSLNGITDALRTSGIEWVHVRHEEVAAFAAGAEAHLTGTIAVCAGSCGPGNLHLINGLFDCHRNRVPVLAIAAQIPSAEMGSGYFQETHPQDLFRECSHYCELVSGANQMPRVLKIAIREAIGKRGVSVIVIPGDVALQPAVGDTPQPSDVLFTRPALVPSESDVNRLADLLNVNSRITLLCGSGCAGAQEQVLQLAEKLKAPIVMALKGKEHLEGNNPYQVGLTGLIGISSGYHAMRECDVLLMLGTDFPYQQFFPESKDAQVVQVDILPENLGRRTRLSLGILGDVTSTLTLLLPQLQPKADDSFLRKAVAHYQRARQELDDLAKEGSSQTLIHPQYVAKTVNRLAAEDAIFHCGVGGTLSLHERSAQAARFVLARLHGKCDGAVDRRAKGVSESAGRFFLRRWWFHDVDGRFPQPCTARVTGKGHRLQQRRPEFYRTGAEGYWLPEHRHRFEEPQLCGYGRSCRNSWHSY